MIQHLTLNALGRDFVIGDIHGCFSALDQALVHIGFNPSCDRLISVGDLVDRGPENMQALHYLQQPWFHAVLGNHDWTHAWDATPTFRLSNHDKSDTAWAQSVRESAEYMVLSDQLKRLPLIMDIETAHGLIGIVHAEVRPTYGHWAEVIELVSRYQSMAEVDIANRLLTGRTRLRKHATLPYDRQVEGVSMVISGHTCVKRPTWVGNSLFIDTGLVYGIQQVDGADAGLSLINLNDAICHYYPVDPRTHRLNLDRVEVSPLNQLTRIVAK
jgi:serine/threonine protein phosphatase 1